MLSTMRHGSLEPGGLSTRESEFVTWHGVRRRLRMPREMLYESLLRTNSAFTGSYKGSLGRSGRALVAERGGTAVRALVKKWCLSIVRSHLEHVVSFSHSERWGGSWIIPALQSAASTKVGSGV